ncbi:hypothetical protein NDU88_008198 [Pleurodeles waltl]|uniref:Uncharacterized protein n=1 Tax=Pleurodeles waltl TaxID=8319 RepID=A0AAV7SUM2_PLEWA|nr:hypothetical protein NDU88_008198 [Pleurodeles waltl]
MHCSQITQTGPKIGNAWITPFTPTRRLRFSNACLAVVPAIRRARRGGRSFQYNVSKLWDSMPTTLQTADWNRHYANSCSHSLVDLLALMADV